ncbi:MAG: hypothetical protein VKQ33_10595, partial [Candidatus Sericytochromatia bacterium]|nr:hypothetical protein [Candidatus Sericytochromatia bacterium]
MSVEGFLHSLAGTSFAGVDGQEHVTTVDLFGYVDVPQEVQAAVRNVLETAPREVLNKAIPNGHTIAISESGEFVGMIRTTEVMNNESLNVGHHDGGITASWGGTISIPSKEDVQGRPLPHASHGLFGGTNSIPSSEDASSDSAREVIGTLLI